MPKKIRFMELVKSSGKPEMAALWTGPRANPAFMKAVRENRVATLVQKPTGTKKDVGHLGFHQQQFANYLVFPKPLPKVADAEIIGIKYDLLKSSDEVVFKESKRRPFPEKKAPKPKPKKFRVVVSRTATEETVLEVTARSIEDAKEDALKKIRRQKFRPETIRESVNSIAEIERRFTPPALRAETLSRRLNRMSARAFTLRQLINNNRGGWPG